MNYQPLHGAQIRLARIVSSTPLEIHMLTVELGSASYCALSYTWGPSTVEQGEYWNTQVFTKVARCYPVICSRSLIWITRSLRDALRSCHEFARPVKNREGTSHVSLGCLWADGLCINQDDLDERSRQVALMGQIYKHADCVVVDLGPEDRHLHGAVQVIERCALQMEHLDSSTAEFFISSGVHRPERQWVKRVHASLFEGGIGMEEALAGSGDINILLIDWIVFMCRQWFFRAWVIQEVASNQLDLAFAICGGKIINLGHAYRALCFIMNKVDRRLYTISCWQHSAGKPLQTRYQDNTAWLGLTQILHPLMIQRYTKGEPQGIASFRSYEYIRCTVMPHVRCTDPRDKLFSIIGLLQEFRTQEPLPLSYSTDVSSALLQVTRFAIEQTGSLKLLRAVKLVVSPDLPSWCPDYTSLVPLTPRPLSVGSINAHGKHIPGLWCAAGSSRHTLISSGNLLRVQGSQCSIITEVLPLAGWTSALQSMSSLLSLLVNHAIANSKWRVSDVFWRTIILDNHDGSLTRATDKERLQQLVGDSLSWHIARTWVIDHGNASILPIWKDLAEKMTVLTAIEGGDISSLPDFRRLQLLWENLTTVQNVVGKSWLQTSENSIVMPANQIVDAAMEIWSDEYCFATRPYHIDLDRIFEHISSVTEGRSLFRTSEGLIGLSHECTIAGDEVWLLAGSEVPFVLRSQPGSYRVVDEAYLHGAMFGGLWSEADQQVDEINLI